METPKKFLMFQEIELLNPEPPPPKKKKKIHPEKNDLYLRK